MTSPPEPDKNVRLPQARPEDEQWWANRIAAQAAERDQSARGAASPGRMADGRESKGGGGLRSAWTALGGGSLSNLSSSGSSGMGGEGGYTPYRPSVLRDLTGTAENPDAGRSALFLLVLSVIAGIGTALVIVLIVVVAISALGG